MSGLFGLSFSKIVPIYTAEVGARKNGICSGNRATKWLFLMNFKQTSLSSLNQVSEKRSALFKKLQINNLEDLLFFFPRDYEDWTEIIPLHLVEDGATVTVKAKIISQPKLQYRGRLSWLRTSLSDGATVISAIWFNQPWLSKKLQVDFEYYFHGKVQPPG